MLLYLLASVVEAVLYAPAPVAVAPSGVPKSAHWTKSFMFATVAPFFQDITYPLSPSAKMPMSVRSSIIVGVPPAVSTV